MTRWTALAAAAALAGPLMLAATPAAAQDEAGDRVNTLIIYGDDECPQSEGDTITVCARMDESERYRIPERLRQSQDPANQSWVSRVKSFEAVGDFGPLSCSPVGAGGELGCTADFIEAAYEAREEGSEVRFSQLIAEARAERLATIDEEAAETQARVEELEREYMERLEAEREAPLPGEEEEAGDAEGPEVVEPTEIPDTPPPPGSR
jgi:hypothetical protein